jgi:hypothetical protein
MFHGDEYKKLNLLECDTAYSGRNVPKFGETYGLQFHREKKDPENGGSSFLRSFILFLHTVRRQIPEGNNFHLYTQALFIFTYRLMI